MIRVPEPNTRLRGIPTVRATTKNSFGVGQLWNPECVSLRPRVLDPGLIAPAPVATCLWYVAPARGARCALAIPGAQSCWEIVDMISISCRAKEKQHSRTSTYQFTQRTH